MPQRKDDERRAAILAEAKRLFALQGYEATSVAIIMANLNMPVGSVYTYFQDKQTLLVTILEEGWEEFSQRLEEVIAQSPNARTSLKIILDQFLPALFGDAEFITLALNEAGRNFSLADKLGWLSDKIGTLIRAISQELNIPMDFDSTMANTALSVYFLGSLQTIRLSKQEGLNISIDDVLHFIRLSIYNTFGSFQ